MVMEDSEFEAPRTMEEALRRYRLLVARLQETDAQLGDDDRRVRVMEGRDARETPQQYREWRQKAIWYKTNRAQELRFLKKWISDERHCKRPALVKEA